MPALWDVFHAVRVYLVAQYWFKRLCGYILRGGVHSLTNDMKLFLAESGGMWEAYFNADQFAHTYILQSFYYADEFTEKHIIPNAADFLLDSGAFTFMQNAKSHVIWEEYLEKYADFINRNNVQKFFELDIDSIVGYEKVKEYRRQLEAKTKKQPIPVWHTSRGKEEFERHCQEYSYVALGGLVGTGKSEYSRKYWKYFPWFINTAHKNKAKIHALGFTSLDGIKQFHFDSVDSTAWTTGNRFGHVYRFDGQTIQKIDVPKGKRLADAKTVALHNYKEWVKFQRYADTHFNNEFATTSTKLRRKYEYFFTVRRNSYYLYNPLNVL